MSGASKRCFLALAVAVFSLPAFAQSSSSIQQSHIDGNVPDAKDFQAFLKRDVLAYLVAKEPGVSEVVQIELLRDAPTQSGVSYPKYYAWVSFKVGVMKLKRGALRLAAIDKTRFEVVDFLPATEIKAGGRAVERVFPHALVSEILARASQP